MTGRWNGATAGSSYSQTAWLSGLWPSSRSFSSSRTQRVSRVTRVRDRRSGVVPVGLEIVVGRETVLVPFKAFGDSATVDGPLSHTPFVLAQEHGAWLGRRVVERPEL